MSNKAKFEMVVSTCEAEVKTLQKAIELDPDNTADYESAIAYSEEVVRMSKINLKAIDIVAEDDKKKQALEKSEEEVQAEKSEKPKPTRRKKAKPADEVPVDPAQDTKIDEQDSLIPDIDSMF